MSEKDLMLHGRGAAPRGESATKVEFFHPTVYDDDPEPYLSMPYWDRPGWQGFVGMLRKVGWMESDTWKFRRTCAVKCAAVNFVIEESPDGARVRGLYWIAERRDL